MDHFDYGAQLRARLAQQGRKVKQEKRDMWSFRCVRHDDKSPSAWMGEHRWGCHTCGFEEPLSTLGDELGLPAPKRGYTIEDYATVKGFSLAKLQQWGLRTIRGDYGDDMLEIPFFGPDGTPVRSKIRTAKGEFWKKGMEGTYLYGVHLVPKTDPKKSVLVVEGCSDVHAAWHLGVLAVGVQGANGWKSEWKPWLANRPVVLWQEPDEAGAKFVAALSRDLPHAKVIRDAGHKDVADLFRNEGDAANALRLLMAQAAPIQELAPKLRFAAVGPRALSQLLTKKLAPVQAIPTPFAGWNAVCRDEGGGRGLARGWHVTAAAKTGNGKSLLGLNLAAAAVRHGERVGIVSLEMSLDQLMTRYLAIFSGVSIRSLEQGPTFKQHEWQTAERIVLEAEVETGGVLFVNEAPLSDLGDIEAAIRYQVGVNGCGMIVTDYMQLAHVQGKRDLLETVTEVSGTLRRLAREMGHVSVGLSQFNRETSKEQPTIHGLMGGSPIENDSDQVVLLDHSDYTPLPDQDAAITRLLVAKNRHGPAARVPIRWDFRCLAARELLDPHDGSNV